MFYAAVTTAVSVTVAVCTSKIVVVAVTVADLTMVQAAGVCLFKRQEQALLIRAGLALMSWMKRGGTLALAGAHTGARLARVEGIGQSIS